MVSHQTFIEVNYPPPNTPQSLNAHSLCSVNLGAYILSQTSSYFVAKAAEGRIAWKESSIPAHTVSHIPNCKTCRMSRCRSARDSACVFGFWEKKIWTLRNTKGKRLEVILKWWMSKCGLDQGLKQQLSVPHSFARDHLNTSQDFSSD